MRNRSLQVLLFLLVTFSFACNRGKVNLEGRWEVVKVSPRKGNITPKDSLSFILLHFAVGNRVEFNGGELGVHRKGTDDAVYYGLGSYKVTKDGRSVKLDAGNYRPVRFKLRNAENDQVELQNKPQNVNVLLKPYEEPEE